MEETNIQPEKATKKLDFHKVFAAIGIILIVLIVVVGGVWYFVQKAEDEVGSDYEDNVVKVSTSSANTATDSATTSAQ